MKSVLFVSLMNGAPWGGSEELWFQTALYAAKHGYKIGCAFYDWPQKKQQIEQLREAGCELYLFFNKGREKRNLRERIQYKITKRLVRHYAKSLPLKTYDSTVINLGHLEIIDHYWKSFLPCVKNYSLLFHVHDETSAIKASRKPLLRKWLLQAEHNLFASMRIKDFLEKDLSIKIPHAATLINPITFKAPAAPPAWPPLVEGNVIFIVLATLDVRRKAQDNLVKALSSAKWKERPWQLYLYGNGESESYLKSLIEEAGLNQKIFLKGHTHNVKAALSEAHLLLQITHIDAMPLAVIEALSMAKPLVVSNVGDMSQWVIENLNGWISHDATVEAVDKTLEACWQNRDRWQEMGSQSYQLFKEKFPVIPEAYFLSQISKTQLSET